MRRLFLLGAALLVACSPPPPPDCFFGGPTSSVPEVAVGYRLAHTRLAVELPRTEFCFVADAVATSATVELFDPDNLPVANTHSAPSSSNTGFSTIVSFTPEKAGLYHLRVTFEPTLGTARRDTIVVDDRTAELGELRGVVPTVCEEVHPVGDTVFCLKSGVVQAWRDGGMEVVSSTARRLDSSADVAWLRDATRVSRFDVADGGLRRMEVGLTEPVAPSGSTPRHYLELGRSVVEDIRVVDGGLTRSSSLPLEATGLGGALALSDNSFGWLSEQALCFASFDGGSRCVKAEGLLPMKASGDSLWLADGAGRIKQWRVLSDGRPPELRSVSTPTSGFVTVSSPYPLFLWEGRYVTIREGDLALEAWPLRSLVSTVTVTSTHVVFRQTNGEVTSYRR